MNALAMPLELPASTAAWAFNETQLQNALARIGDLELTEAVLEFLHSVHAQKLRINDGRQTGGLIVPRHRRAVTGAGVIFGRRLYLSPNLAAYEGATVLVSFEPNSIERVNVHSLDGEFITTAPRAVGGAR